MESIRRLAERARHDRADLDAILDAALVGTFATVVDGRPLTVPMLYGRIGDQLYLHGSTGAGALRQVAAGAACNLCVTLLDSLVVADSLFESSANYRSAVVRGTADRVGADEAYDALNAMSERLIPGRSRELRGHTAKEIAATMVLKLEIGADNWTAKVRTGFPTEPEDAAVWAGIVPIATTFGPPVAAPWISSETAVPASVAALGGRS